MNNNFEEALSNIDVFCSVLVRKMIEDVEPQIKPEIIENLLRRKYVIEIYRDNGQIEKPPIDVFEDENQVKIFVHRACIKQEVRFNPCRDYTEIWIGENQKIRLPIDPPNINKTTIKLNNHILEITIQK